MGRRVGEQYTGKSCHVLFDKCLILKTFYLDPIDKIIQHGNKKIFSSYWSHFIHAIYLILQLLIHDATILICDIYLSGNNIILYLHR